MSNKLFGKFFIFLLVVGLLFAVAPTRQALAQTPTVVTTEAELTAALADPNITQIELGADITLTSTAYVTRDGVSIDGKSFTITGPTVYHGIDVSGDNVTISNLTITGSAKSNLQFYRATGGVVTNVVLSNAGNAGMIVNGSRVTITNVTTTKNAWGGINVDQGSGVTETPLLTVTNVTIHTSPTAGVTPAIWVDKGNTAWVAVGDLYTVVTPPNGYLVFYDNTEFATIAANFPIHNETLDIYYATIQNAIDAATPGDTITVNGTHVLTSVVNVNKAVTLTCATGAKIQVSGTGDRFDVSAAATIQNCEIEKTDKSGEQNIIRIRSSNVTISNNHIHGQYVLGDGDVTRAMVINAGAFTGLSITGNEIHNLRQPAYISGTHTGMISNNYVHGTKGWVLEGGNLTFTGNIWGTGANANVYDIALLSTIGPSYYKDVPAMSVANNNAFIEDQRYSTPLLTPVYVDASVPTCSDCGTARMPYDTIQEGVDRVIPGGTVNVLGGIYTEQIIVNDKDGITIVGAGETATKIVSPNILTALVGDRKPVVGINASENVTIKNLTIDGEGKGNANYRFYGLFYYNSGGLIDHVTVKDIRNTPLDGAQSGGAIYGYITDSVARTLTTQYSTAIGYQKGGFTYNGVGLTAIVDHNTATGAGQTPLISMNGFQIGYSANATLTYNTTSGNYYTGDPANGLATGILLYQPGNVTAQNNTVTTSNYGIALIDGANVSITGNVVADNQYGLDLTNNAATVENNQITGSTALALWSDKIVDASPNWWGSAAGPAVGSIEGPATYIPWCGEAACTTLVYPPVHNVTQGTWYSTIQAAIDAAVDGNTIEVGPGTYPETITLNKPNITVKSTNGAATTIISTPSGTLTTGVQVLANMGTVTFDGFTVSNFTESGIVQSMANATGTAFIVKNNVITPANGYLRNGIQVSGNGSQVIGNTVNGAPLTDSWSSSGILAVNGSNILIEGNTISGGTLGLDIGIGVQSYSANAANVTIRNNTITNVGNGIRLEGGATTMTLTGVLIKSNTIDGSNRAINSQWVTLVDIEAHLNKFLDTADEVLRISESSALGSMDATHNWFGDALGPQNPIIGDIQVIQWCADAGCTTFLPDDDGKVTISGASFTQTGAIKIYVDGVNYYLPAGTTIRNSSPCFEVYADDIKIYTDYPAAAKCVPTNGSDGIWVADDVQNLRVVNLEFDGTDQTTGSGIFFAGDAVGFQVVDNYFHNLDGSGVVFIGTPSGTTMDIQGNMFRDLGAAAITVPTGLEPDLNAEFNSWGVYAGATLTDVDTEPHTHADFYMTFEGDTPLEKVAIGNTIKYTVYGNLQNIAGADFTLKFPTGYLDAGTPTNLSAFVAAGPAMFVVDETAGTIRFQGDAPSAPITGQNLPIFEVVFTGTAAGTGAISFDQTNDAFAMFPGYGPSTWVYAAGYVDNEIEVFLDETTPTLETWTPDEGDIYLAGGEDFVLTVDALDDYLFSLEIDHNMEGILPEFSVYADATDPYGGYGAQFEAAGVTATYNETTQTWVITFDSAGSALAQLLAKKDVEFYAVLHDQAGKTWGSMSPTTPENTFAYSIVFDNTAPALESWAPVKNVTYMLTPSGDFVLTVNALDVNLYGLELDHSLEGVLPEFWVYADATDPYGGDGAAFATAGVEVTYNATTQTWTLTFKDGMPALNAIIANQGITFYAVIHDLAGNQWGSMYTVTPDNTFAYTLYQQQPIARADSTGGDVVAVVTADGNTINFTGEVDWYPADPDLGRTSGHRIGVRLSAPELDFGTSDTTFTFNGQTYDWDLVKDGDDYVLVYPKVTAEHQSWVIVVTWGGGFSQTFTVNFDGTLGPVTAYTVDGEISMQGRVARNTEDVITLDGYMLDDFTADSLDKLGINYTLANVLTGKYTITTHQPRYLNITADLNKSITLISNRTLPALWLRAGNAVWTGHATSNNQIDLADANQIGTDWGKTTNPDGNVNFDNIVNIQDLALVGGNYSLTSAAAYASWLP